MLMRSRGRGAFFALAGVVLAFLAAPARGDHLRYVPNNARIVLSVDVQGALKSKAVQELRDGMKAAGAKETDLEKGLAGELGLPVASMARLTWGVSLPGCICRGNEIKVLTTRQPITAAGILATKTPRGDKVVRAYKEVKVGRFVVHEEHFQAPVKGGKKGALSGPQRGEAFCVVDGRTVLFGTLQGDSELRKVLERDKLPALSAAMQAALKAAPFTNTAVVTVDIQGLSAEERDEAFQGLPFPRVAKEVSKFQALAVRANGDGRLTASVTALCKDAAGAAAVKRAAEATLADLEGRWKKAAKGLAPEVVKGTNEVLGGIRVSAEGDRVSVGAAASPAAALRFFAGLGVALKGPGGR